MDPDELLGEFSRHLQDAARAQRFKCRPDKSLRPFGGSNFLRFRDMYQLPPIPTTAALCLPPNEKGGLSRVGYELRDNSSLKRPPKEGA